MRVLRSITSLSCYVCHVMRCPPAVPAVPQQSLTGGLSRTAGGLLGNCWWTVGVMSIAWCWRRLDRYCYCFSEVNVQNLKVGTVGGMVFLSFWYILDKDSKNRRKLQIVIPFSKFNSLYPLPDKGRPTGQHFSFSLALSGAGLPVSLLPSML